MSSREISLWLDERWYAAINRQLKNETLEEHLESVIDELCNKLPDIEKAHFTGRLTPAEYEPFGPVELFCSSFRRDWKAVLDMIAEMRK